jgi:polyhydroxyalkanoate synthase subunit PhaC
MKKLAKIIGFVGVAGAVIWAMRDRFISVAVSREPDAPLFRAMRPAEPGAEIDAVDGIGPVYATRLRASGLRSISDLARATPDTVAEAAGVSGARARSWIDQAQTRS